jgi:hypothetical protein
MQEDATRSRESHLPLYLDQSWPALWQAAPDLVSVSIAVGTDEVATCATGRTTAFYTGESEASAES